MPSRDKSLDPAADTPGRAAAAGDTVASSRDDALPDPKLPHERDESASHQGTEPRGRIEQARQDVESGQADTGKRPAMDEAYEQQKQGG